MPSKNIQTWKDLKKKNKSKSRFSKILTDDTMHQDQHLDEVYADQDEPNTEIKNDPETTKPISEPELVEKPSKRKKLPQAPRARWVALIVVVGGLLAWAAGWWVFTVAKPSPGGVDLQLNAPMMVTSGGEVNLKVSIHNKERSSVENAELNFQWPEGIRVLSSSLDTLNENQNIWLIPEIKSNGIYEFEIKLQVFGTEGESRKFSANLVYELANFSSEFFVNTEHDLNIGTAKLGVKIEGPSETTPLTEASWQLTVTNQTEAELKDAIFEILAPVTLIEIETDPKTPVLNEKEQVRLQFDLTDLQPGAEQVIDLTGIFAAGSQGNHNFVWQLVEDPDQTHQVTQEGEYEIFVAGDEVELKILVNDFEEIDSLSWGDLVEVTLAAKNITSQDLNNIDWTLEITGDPFDWNTFATANNVVVEEPGLVKINSGDNEAQLILASGEELQVSFQVRLKNQATPTNQISLKANLKTQVGTEETSETASFSKELKNILIKNAINWHVTARYYDDEGIVVGDGPLPPRVGEATTYRIYWNISDKAENIDRIVVSTSLPSNALWANEFNAVRGLIKYQSAVRQVEWTVTNADSYDLSQGELEAYFEVRVVPNQDAVGSTLPLTSGIDMQIFQTDNTAKAYSKPLLSTALEGDLYASGQGVVVSGE